MPQDAVARVSDLIEYLYSALSLAERASYLRQAPRGWCGLKSDASRAAISMDRWKSQKPLMAGVSSEVWLRLGGLTGSPRMRLRDGRVVTCDSVSAFDQETLVHAIAGQGSEGLSPSRRAPGEIVFQVRNVTGRALTGLTFDLRDGESRRHRGSDRFGSGSSERIRNDAL